MNTVVIEARAWIGTPYVHQASAKGAGCDCLGLIRGVWRGLYVAEPVAVPHYTADWSEPQGEEALWDAARAHLHGADASDLAAGQIVLFRMREGGVAKHLGIVSAAGAAPAFIHAYTRHGVVESPLSDPWVRRIVARFAFQKG